MLLMMMRLKAMHGESKAAICGDLEAEGADVSLADVCIVAKL